MRLRRADQHRIGHAFSFHGRVRLPVDQVGRSQKVEIRPRVGGERQQYVRAGRARLNRREHRRQRSIPSGLQ